MLVLCVLKEGWSSNTERDELAPRFELETVWDYKFKKHNSSISGSELSEDSLFLGSLTASNLVSPKDGPAKENGLQPRKHFWLSTKVDLMPGS